MMPSLARSRRLGFSVLLLCGSVGVRAQQPAPPGAIPPPAPVRRHSLNLDAQSVANGGGAQVSGDAHGLPYSGGSYTSTQSVSDRRVANSQQNVKFSVHNFNSVPDDATVEWYFVATPAGGTLASQEFIFDRGSQALTVPGGGEQSQTVTSKRVEAVYERSTTVTTTPSSVFGPGGTSTSLTNSQRGTTPKGWMVRLLADGHVLAVRGSSQHFEDIAKDEARLKEMSGHNALPGSQPDPLRMNRLPRVLPGGSPSFPLVPGSPSR